MSGSDSVLGNTKLDKSICEQMAINACTKMLAEDEKLYGAGKIKDLHVRSNDLGEAAGIYIVGPEMAGILGEARVRQLGQTVVLGGAALYGIEDQMKEHVDHPVEAVRDTIINYSAGAGIGALETVSPYGALGLAAIGTAMAITQGAHQVYGAEYKERNANLTKAINKTGNLDSVGLVASADAVRQVSEPAADVACGLATTVSGIKGGNRLGKDFGDCLPKVTISGIQEAVTEGLKAVQDEIRTFFPDKKLEFAPAVAGKDFALGRFAPLRDRFEKLVAYSKGHDNAGEPWRLPGSDADEYGWITGKNGEKWRPLRDQDRALILSHPDGEGWTAVKGSTMELWQRTDKDVTEFLSPGKCFSISDSRGHLFYDANKNIEVFRPGTFTSALERQEKESTFVFEGNQTLRAANARLGVHPKY
jgi:hypothetical protein